ncbi:hypothetical protein FO440_19480 [Mucilaginibacter corticis]|uniref:RHS repeat protein n=1 Tax=Mucilaginibacter corticis TaxID=2597670 RepID=A0A556MFR5_9SPHI|nr:hypothetical protein [Mucilaginibacter corticis]TSJ38689.1 hypothetical protein FO440_19480 [Mucilaginibacter corticis]
MIRQLSNSFFFVILLLTSTTINAVAQFSYKVYAGSKPKGKIDSVITTLSDQNKTVEIFDKKRQLVEFYEYRNTIYEFGMVRDTTRTFYYYDKKGLLLKSVNFRVSYFPSASPKHQTDSTIWHFVKEGAGYIAKFDWHNGSTVEHIYKLNEAFQLIEESFNPIGDNQNWFYEYDKNGYLTKQTMVLPPRYHVKNEKYYVNDANGNIITADIPNTEDTLSQTFKYFYTHFDKAGNWLEKKIYRLITEDFEDYLLNKEDYLWNKQERRITYYK